MDPFSLQDQLLHKILLSPNNNARQIQQLIRWNKDNKPPMSILKSQFEDYLQRHHLLEESLRIADCVLESLVKNRANVSILRAYLNLVREDGKLEGETKGKVKRLWKVVPVECLELFLDTFGIREEVAEDEIDEYVKELIVAKRFDDCLKLAKIFGQQQKHIKQLLNSMATNSAASKAANFITSLNLNKQQYPQIQQRLAKKCMRHFLKKQGWHYVEELYSDSPLMLAYAIEDLIHDKKIDEAMTLYVRGLKGNEGLVKKEETIEEIKRIEGEKGYKELGNPLIEKSGFGPVDEKRFLTLAEFGIKQGDVVMIDDDTPELEKHLKELFSSPMLGFDTQSLVGLTKLQQQSDGLATIQVASPTKICIFDAFKLTSPIISQHFHQYFTNPSTLKLGHAVCPDLRQICLSLKLQKSVQRIIDTWQIFKGLHPEQKQSNLSHICKRVLGKEICKAQTLTNWKRRPLRKAQLHYAAMDAFVVIKIYERLLKEYGEQYLMHFVEEDELRQQVEDS